MKRRVLIPLMLALLLMAALVPAAWAGPLTDTVVEENEIVNNDIILLDGALEVREGAQVNGDVVVFNGDATIEGSINGSVTLFNGNLIAGPNASVRGECVLLNGKLTGADVLGKCTAVENGLNLAPLGKLVPLIPPVPTVPPIPALPAVPAVPAIPEPPAMQIPPVPRAFVEDGVGTLGQVAGAVATTLLFTVLALLVAAVMPNQLRQIVRTAREKPVVSGMAGVLTAVAVPSLIVLLIPLSIVLTLICVGLLGFPIMLVLGVGLIAGMLIGWVTVGTWLGVRLFGHGKDDRILRSAVLGTALLTLVIGLLGTIPFVIGETLLAVAIASIGLGAVALTQFGMKSFPRQPRAGAPGDGPDADKVETVLLTLPPEEKTAGQRA